MSLQCTGTTRFYDSTLAKVYKDILLELAHAHSCPVAKDPTVVQDPMLHVA